MFDYERTLAALDDFENLKEKKRQKFLKNLFMDDTFNEWLFQPKKVPNLQEMTNAIFARITKPKVLRSITEMIEDVGYDEFNRSNATFMYSICNIAIASNNERIIEMDRQYKAGDLTKSEYNNTRENCDKYNQYVANLLKTLKKIVKPDAKELAKDCNLPKYICVTAYHTVPEAKYINHYQVGGYLNVLLNDIYSEVGSMGQFSSVPRWKKFFQAVFGKDNIIEVAYFIILEGVHRIDQYGDSKDVKTCWDSLTEFALAELNNAPEALRNQMVELYIKRIDKMFENRAFDLRVNLMSIDESTFPKLVDTIQNYAEKIQNILNRKS